MENGSGAERREHHLRAVLRTNVAMSAATGALCLVAADPLGDLMGVERVGLIRLVGAGLALFALEVWLLARAGEGRLVAGAHAVAVADFGWTAVMVALVAAGVFDPAGAVVSLATGVATGVLAWFEWTGASEMKRLHTTQEVHA